MFTLDCVAAVEKTGKMLESLGHHVEYSYPPAFEGSNRTRLGVTDHLPSSRLVASLDELVALTESRSPPPEVELMTWQTVGRRAHFQQSRFTRQ
ncbi:MAG: hypothetical protein U0528_20235 [Anaerolineae bacterium]